MDWLALHPDRRYSLVLIPDADVYKRILSGRNRLVMRSSNSFAIGELQKMGYDHIWLKRHTRFGDYHYSKDGNYYGIDLWNMWDGICINSDGEAVYLAIKTNRWDSAKKIRKWLENKKNFKVLSINVETKGIKKMRIRKFP